MPILKDFARRILRPPLTFNLRPRRLSTPSDAFELHPRLRAASAEALGVTVQNHAKAQADALYKTAYAETPHVTFVDIGDAAHFVMLDQPEAFARAVDAFAGR